MFDDAAQEPAPIDPAYAILMLSLTDPAFANAEHPWTAILRYLHGARIQMDRIWDAMAIVDARHRELSDYNPASPYHSESADLDERFDYLEWKRSVNDQRRLLHRRYLDALDQPIVEAHFYLTCWHRINRFVYVIQKRTNLPEVVSFAKRHHAHRDPPRYHEARREQELGWYGCGRNALDHWEERLPAENKDSLTHLTTRPVPADLMGGTRVRDESDSTIYVAAGVISGTNLVIGDNTWDISPDSYVRLAGYVEELGNMFIREWMRRKQTNPLQQ